MKKKHQNGLYIEGKNLKVKVNRHKYNISADSVGHATDMAVLLGNESIKRTDNFRDDVKKKLRLASGSCRWCYYMASKIGGSAMTTQPCGICGEDQMYGSTCVDRICLPCGKKQELCVHCGGDIKMRLRRKFVLKE